MPSQIKIAFPKTDGRSFSSSYYTKQLANGEQCSRDWLLYSQSLDAICCFCCRVFGNNTIDIGINSSKGFRDWAHSTRTIKAHEKSASHLENYLKWKTLDRTIAQKKTIENQLFKEMQLEKERLRQVFKRLIAFTLYLARQNIAFIGRSTNINDPEGRNGNFQQLIHTCAEFDPVLKEHLEKHDKVHYMSPKTQNELIDIIGLKVQNRILDCVKQSKYYAIILDGTTDITHTEQMCIVLRYVHLDEESRKWEIKESFVKFADISSSKTGELITNAAVFELNKLGLNLDDMRGQGFDNGAPMTGKNVGVQKRILEQNPRAFFNPCGNHSLNLAVNDAADSSKIATQFFSIVQKIYVFLSAATNRWDVLKEHLAPTKAKTPKQLCTTRWSSRVNAVRPLCKNPGAILAALKEIHESNSFNASVRLEAESLADKIDFAFICSSVLWYDILSHVNIASKALQSVKSNIQSALMCLESVLAFLLEYKENGCEEVIDEAIKICQLNSIETAFDDQKRISAGRITVEDEIEFEKKVFLPIIQAAIDSISKRSEALKKHNEVFEFLYDYKNYKKNKANGALLDSCKN